MRKKIMTRTIPEKKCLLLCLVWGNATVLR